MSCGAAVAMCVLASSCGLVFGVRGTYPTEPGTPLKAFKRDLGLAAAGGPTSSNEVSKGRLARFSAVELDRYVAERKQARAILTAALGDSQDLDKLPSGGETRVQRLARAIGLLELNRPAESAALLQQIVDADPRHFAAIEFLAESWMARGEHGKAELLWRDLVAGIPTDKTFQFRLADALYAQKSDAKKDEARRRLAGMIPGPWDVDAARTLAMVYRDEYRAADAEAVLRKALVARPEHDMLTVMLAQAHRYQGRHGESVELLKPIAARPGKWQPHATYELTLSHRALMQFDAALARVEDLFRGNFEGYVARRRKTLEALRSDLQREKQLGRRVTFSPFELRHRLRESEDPAVRMHAMEVLSANIELVPGVESDFRYVLREDSETRVRREAMLLLRKHKPKDPGPLSTLLRDAAPRNRMIAANLVVRDFPLTARQQVYAALSREQDVRAFKHMHDLLEKLSRDSFFLEAGQVEKPEGRAKVCAEWARRLGIAEKGKKEE